jgi:hypothetical protein
MEQKMTPTTKLTFRILAAMMLTLTSIHAATYTWTGAVSDDWTNSGNWDVNGVPVDYTGGTSGLGFQSST